MKYTNDGTQNIKLHTVAPYIGKMRPEIANWAIDCISEEGDLIYDPFCGSGTVLLEGWLKNRRVIGADLNPYACLISKAKINPYIISDSEYIECKLNNYHYLVKRNLRYIDLNQVPNWVRDFYHPQTLHELLAWVKVLKKNHDHFALSCLIGIAHHQRPGFLSYPSSHTVPYLRANKFPKELHPELYEYREIKSRLLKKMVRALSSMTDFDYDISRSVIEKDAANICLPEKVDAIITSPPYI